MASIGSSAFRGSLQRRGRAGARPEIPQLEFGEFGLSKRPLREQAEPPGKKIDIETQVSGLLIVPLLALGEQIDEQRSIAAATEGMRHESIARTQVAAAAAVGEDHKPLGIDRRHQVSSQERPVHGNLNGSTVLSQQSHGEIQTRQPPSRFASVEQSPTRIGFANGEAIALRAKPGAISDKWRNAKFEGRGDSECESEGT